MFSYSFLSMIQKFATAHIDKKIDQTIERKSDLDLCAWHVFYLWRGKNLQ
jgi:hypothetical protein